jgi:hypothetical protein
VGNDICEPVYSDACQVMFNCIYGPETADEVGNVKKYQAFVTGGHEGYIEVTEDTCTADAACTWDVLQGDTLDQLVASGNHIRSNQKRCISKDTFMDFCAYTDCVEEMVAGVGTCNPVKYADDCAAVVEPANLLRQNDYDAAREEATARGASEAVGLGSVALPLFCHRSSIVHVYHIHKHIRHRSCCITTMRLNPRSYKEWMMLMQRWRLAPSGPARGGHAPFAFPIASLLSIVFLYGCAGCLFLIKKYGPFFVAVRPRKTLLRPVQRAPSSRRWLHSSWVLTSNRADDDKSWSARLRPALETHYSSTASDTHSSNSGPRRSMIRMISAMG